MWTERIKEVIAILLVGDGVVALVNPFRHSLLWRSGPGLWERLMDPFVETPALTRCVEFTQGDPPGIVQKSRAP